MSVTLRTQVASDSDAPQTAPPERTVRFAVFGDFAGRETDALERRAVNRNTWEDLFQQLKPELSLQIELPKVDDLNIVLRFDKLGDFRERSLKVPFLQALKTLRAKVASASKTEPVNLAEALAESMLKPLAAIAEQSGGGGEVIDLLSMVDIGEDDDSGLATPTLKRERARTDYQGEDRGKLTAELDKVRDHVVDHIVKDANFQALHGRWRALKTLLGLQGVDVDLIDCTKDQLCDATFELFVRPSEGAPPPLDLGIFCDDFGLNEEDRHIVHHLGRMAEAIATPFLLNAGLDLFGCKSWRLLSHISDIHTRFGDAQHIKWRKLREESGARWLFLLANPIALEGEDDEEGPLMPASFYPALLIADRIAESKWPGELLHPGFQKDIGRRCATHLSEDQGYDLAFEGISAISGDEKGERIFLLGMTALAKISLPAREQLKAVNLVEFTLSYAFFTGCLARFIQTEAESADLLDKLRAYVGVKAAEDVVYEESEGRHIFRIKGPFTIFGSQPDVVLGL